MLQQCYMELLKQKEGGNRMNHYEAINDVLVNFILMRFWTWKNGH